MPALNDIRVNIKINDNGIRSYDDPHGGVDDTVGPRGQHIITKYIEAQAGRQFSIRVKAKGHRNLGPACVGLIYHIFIDGVLVNKRCCGGFPHRKLIDGALRGTEGNFLTYPFLFAETPKDERRNLSEAAIERHKQKLDKIGTITVVVWRISGWELSPLTTRDYDWGAELVGEDVAVPQKAMLQKGNSLRTSLGAGKPASRIGWALPEQIDGDDNPYVVFNFLYRSKSALQDLLITPRSPTPEPLENREVDNLNEAELRTLVNQLRGNERARTPVPKQAKETKKQVQEAKKDVKKDANISRKTLTLKMSNKKDVTERAGNRRHARMRVEAGGDVEENPRGIKREAPDDDELMVVGSRPAKRFHGVSIDLTGLDDD